MKKLIKNIEYLRVLSQIFSPPTFQKIVQQNDFGYFEKKTEKYFKEIPYIDNFHKLSILYESLKRAYRCEYIYKNSLFIDIIRKYGLIDSLTINELKIGKSKADLVLLNGIIRIYEIKTELDSLSKLSKQLDDYIKFADKVYVVTDETYASKILENSDFCNIGIIIFDKKNKLNTIRESNISPLSFDFSTIFKMLRKKEYLELVYEHFGLIPNVPNTKIYKICYQILSELDTAFFQKQVLKKLKERKLFLPELLNSKDTPSELKYLCNSLNFNEDDYNKLYNFLSCKN